MKKHIILVGAAFALLAGTAHAQSVNATVKKVDEAQGKVTLDHGPIVVQAAVPVLDGDDAATLAARVLAQEHRIYPMAVRWFVEGRLRVVDGRVGLDAPQGQSSTLISPQAPDCRR